MSSFQTAHEAGRSVWQATTTPAEHAPLATSLQTDVCIVGAGIAGLSTAYFLARSGKNVVVVDSRATAGGESAHTTAHLTNMLDLGYAGIIDKHGLSGARLAADSHTTAIDQIERICTMEGIDAEFERLDGYLFLAPDDTRDTLLSELEAARRAGLSYVQFLDDVPGPRVGPGLRFPRQGQFHVLKYLNGLVAAIERLGGKIYAGTHINGVQGGLRPQVSTSAGHTITADAVVLATNSPITDVLGLSVKQSPNITYVIGIQIPRGVMSRALYYDTAEPYHYVRFEAEPSSGAGSEYDTLIVGGEDHATGADGADADERFARLEQWTRERFPMVGAVTFRWAGQVLDSVDGLAFIGSDLVDSNVYIATGFTGNGMTHGTIAGMVLADLIRGNPNPWASLYDPARIQPRSLPDIVRQGVSDLLQYSEWLTGGDVRSETQIPLGSGAVIGWGLGKVAVYRDEQGRFHRSSAVCNHLGCIVAWNDHEKTWDCPCHGSRYDPQGEVIHGPAAERLRPIEE